MARSFDVPIRWNLGVVTAVHPSALPDGTVQSMRNAVNAGGAIRLDARYALWGGDTAQLAQGFGYGRYETSRAYLVVAGRNLYRVQNGTYTAVTGLGTLDAGNWFVTQFEDKFYFCNATGGLAYMDVNGPSVGSVVLPSAPASAPTFRRDLTQVQSDFFGGTFSASSVGGTATVTASYDSAFPGVKIVCSAASIVEGTFTFDTSPDERVTVPYNDVVIFPMRAIGAFSWATLSIQTWTSKGSDTVDYSYSHVDVSIPDGRSGGFGHRIVQAWPGIRRSVRSPLSDVKVLFNFGDGGGTVWIGNPRYAGVWLSLNNNRQYSYPLPFDKLQYACTYYNSTTGFESALSPVATIEPTGQSAEGDWFTLSIAGPTESGVDKVRFYRGITRDGVTTWYRLATENDATTVTHTDKLTVTEVEALDTYRPSAPPNDSGSATGGSVTGANAIATWQNRLVLGTGSIVWISREGRPLEFESLDGESTDPLDEGRGLTFYPDDKRSEAIQSIIGQNSLYIVTDLSVRAVIGSTPSNWRLVKLAENEGACGPRAACAYLGGVLVLTPSGRLMFFTEGSAPANIGEALLPRVGHEGLRAYATADAVVTADPKGDVHVRSGAEYLILSQGAWRDGAYAHATHATAFVSGEPNRFLGVDGLIYEMGDDQETDAGTEVTWSVQTRQYSFPEPATPESVNWGDTTEGLDTDGTLLYPTIVADTDRRTTGPQAKVTGKRNMLIQKETPNLVVGEEMTFTIDGNKDVVMTGCLVRMTSSGPGRHL